MIVSILCFSFRTDQSVSVVLQAGTTIPLETVSVIRSNTITVGQMIDFKVKYDIKVEDKIVIPAGSIAKGQVMRAQKAKGLGKAGFIEVQIKNVQSVDGQDIFLTGGNIYQEGEDKETLSIVLGILVCILFLTMKGKDAEIAPGFQVEPVVAVNTTINVE